MDFEKAALAFTMKEPFYGIMLSAMNRVPTDKIDTLAVGKSGNVFKLYYNPKFTDTLSLDVLVEFIKHEILHVGFHHFSMWGDPEGFIPDEHERKLRNIAEDLEVNCYLDKSVVGNEKILWCKDFQLDECLGAREYYRIIKEVEEQQQQQQQAAGSPNTPCNGGQSTQNQSLAQQNPQNQQNQQNQQQGQSQSSNQQASQNSGAQSGPQQPGQAQQQNSKSRFSDLSTFDDHSNWPKLSQEEAEVADQMVDDIIAFAAEEVEKSCGSVPGAFKGRLEKIRKKPKPVCDWRKYLRRYIGNEFTEEIRKSKKRESRRFPDAAGNRHKRKSHILVAIDTSGSVSMPEYKEFFGQIRTLCDRATFHVVECDTVIQYEYDYQFKENTCLHGGGGTQFEPPIDMFIENRRKYDALIYFTDGYANIPSNTPKDTLWVISSRGDKDRKKYQVNGANVVFIKPTEK